MENIHLNNVPTMNITEIVNTLSESYISYIEVISIIRKKQTSTECLLFFDHNMTSSFQYYYTTNLKICNIFLIILLKIVRYFSTKF